MDDTLSNPPGSFVIPAGMLCPGCRYQLGGQVSLLCSECGRCITQHDIECFQRFPLTDSQYRLEYWRVAGVGILAVVALEGSRWAVIGRASYGLWGFVIGIGIVALCLAAAFFTSKACEKSRSQVIAHLFLESAQWLFAPWVLSVAGALVVWMSEYAANTGNRPFAELAVFGCFFFWALLSLVLLPVMYTVRVRRHCHAACVPVGAAWTMFAVALWCLSIGYGFLSIVQILGSFFF